MALFEVHFETSSITDIIQAICAVISVFLTFITVWKLVSYDKQRASEISSLSSIAVQLTKLLDANELRYKNSKRPILDIQVTYLENQITFTFTDTNLSSTLVHAAIKNEREDYKKYTAATTGVVVNKGHKSFNIFLTLKVNTIDFSQLHLDYSTEEGYIFSQDITFWIEDKKVKYSPSPIVDNNNLPENKNKVAAT